jgi:hypothetical protein
VSRLESRGRKHDVVAAKLRERRGGPLFKDAMLEGLGVMAQDKSTHINKETVNYLFSMLEHGLKFYILQKFGKKNKE